jgi:fructokinase
MEFQQMNMVAARKELLDDEVKLDLALTSDKPTCLAIISLDANGGASYEFKIDGTATFDFDLKWLPDPSRYKPQVLHIGTLVTVIQPGADVYTTGRCRLLSLHRLSLIQIFVHL